MSKHSGLSRRAWLKTAAAIGATTACSSSVSGAASAAEENPKPSFIASAAQTPAEWKDRAPIQLKDLRHTVGTRARQTQPLVLLVSVVDAAAGRDAVALMSAYADVDVSDSFNYLSRSRDGGLTWDEPRVIGDAGLSHLLLPDGSAVVIPYYLRPRAEGAIGAPCNILSPKGHLTMRPSGLTVSGWPRPPKSKGLDLGTAGFVFNGQVVKSHDGGYLTTLYGHFEGDSRYSLVLAESADGFDWQIKTVIAGADCPLKGEEGPCESAIARLDDGRLMCVFRLASFVPYGQTWSDDDGRTWTKPVAIPPNSVEPSLAVMPKGVVALSGGRPGVFVWFSTNGRGTEWQAIDVVAHHNACRPEDVINPDSRKGWVNRDEMIRQGLGGFSSCYTELMRLDDRHLLLIYDRLGLGWHQIPDESPETNNVWVIRITVDQ